MKAIGNSVLNVFLSQSIELLWESRGLDSSELLAEMREGSSVRVSVILMPKSGDSGPVVEVAQLQLIHSATERASEEFRDIGLEILSNPVNLRHRMKLVERLMVSAAMTSPFAGFLTSRSPGLQDLRREFRIDFRVCAFTKIEIIRLSGGAKNGDLAFCQMVENSSERAEISLTLLDALPQAAELLSKLESGIERSRTGSDCWTPVAGEEFRRRFSLGKRDGPFQLLEDLPRPRSDSQDSAHSLTAAEPREARPRSEAIEESACTESTSSLGLRKSSEGGLEQSELELKTPKEIPDTNELFVALKRLRKTFVQEMRKEKEDPQTNLSKPKRFASFLAA